MAEPDEQPHHETNFRKPKKGLWRNRLEVVKFERTQKDFAFTRYFIGGEKPEMAAFYPNIRQWRDDRLTMCWLGHATVLINFFGTWILTDPAFSDRVGPRPLGAFTIGPRRLVSPPLEPDDLPDIDLLLISHCHLDHTDMPSLQRIKNVRHVAIPTNTCDVFDRLKYPDCNEMEWLDTKVFEDIGVSVTSIEVKHFGWRFPWEPCRSRGEVGGRSYNAYYVEKKDPDGKTRGILFGGDTAYSKTFEKFGDELRAAGKEIDVAIMAIGAYNPWVGAHCNPEQAWQMVEEMNAKRICPIHWNTYTQSSEPRYEPIEWLEYAVDDPDKIVLRNIGETWSTP